MINRNILSTAAQNALPSGVRRMFELAKKYPDAINLTLGEPGFTTPDHIIRAGVRGLQAGKTKYTPSAGIKELRDAIAWKLKKENGIICDPDKHLIVDGLNEIRGFSCLCPKGAFYVFPNITGFKMSSAQTAEYILEKTHVVTSPGSAFGPDGEGYIRICYASRYEDIAQAMERMKKAFGAK